MTIIQKMNINRLPVSTLLFASAFLILFSLVGCDSSTKDNEYKPMLGDNSASVVEREAFDYLPLPGDDWQVSTPAEQNLDSRLLVDLYQNAAELKKLYGLLVVKNGHLVAEAYFNEGSIGQKARLQSVTKSYTSALVGIAIEQGCISSVDQKMVDFFPELADKITDPRKKEITIRQMLQMRGGYPWEETHPALWDGLLSGYYLPLIEDFPLIADPGTEFHYSNLTSNWLGIIVDRACGTNLKSYAEQHLFLPTNTEAGEWGTDWEGHNNGCGDLHLTARDMAKFGQLYLDDGNFQDHQIIPADWVEASLQTYSKGAWDNIGRFRDIGYGYHWWTAMAGDHEVDFAWGHGGQLIVLVDALDMVIVVTADPFYLEHSSDSWKHERSHIGLVADFIASLPGAQ